MRTQRPHPGQSDAAHSPRRRLHRARFGHDAPGMKRAHKKGASDAALQTRYALDPISGGAGLRVNFVRLVRA